ncbi:MAG: single-stranded-DNA-specific exonuclease RecJ, partial [Planctomycetes bacterium RBG_16_43_13]
MPEKRWLFYKRDDGLCLSLARELNSSNLLPHLLINRGVRDITSAKKFLYPELSDLIDPFLFNDMEKAVKRVFRIIQNKEHIIIYGDYDVDGVTGTAILYNLFKILGVNVDYYIPSRFKDGYGMNKAAIEKFKGDGVSAIITVDCGTSDVEEVELASSAGIDVIIVDHHEPPEKLPAYYAMINPKMHGSTYNFTGITSAGIAFKLAWAISQRMSNSFKASDAFHTFLVDSMGLATLGIIADVAPLVEENRIFAAYGLDAIRRCKNIGMRGLVSKAKLDDKKIEPYDVSFRLAPRLNAGGRLDTAQQCVELFTTSSQEVVDKILAKLDKFNIERRNVQNDILEDALRMAEIEVDVNRDNIIVLAGEKWHSGVIGIVAAKLVEEYYKPTILIALNGETGRGSARSVRGFNIHEALTSCKDLLIDYGGHPMAAGLTIKSENVEKLYKRLNKFAKQAIAAEDTEPTLNIDCELPLTYVTNEIAGEVERLGPYGVGNPKPLFAITGAKVAGEPKLIGSNYNHLS